MAQREAMDTGAQQKSSGAGPVLQVAVLCAPSRWRLHEKMGRPLADIHQPVPLYADRLAAPVDRFMRHLKPGKLASAFRRPNPARSRTAGWRC